MYILCKGTTPLGALMGPLLGPILGVGKLWPHPWPWGPRTRDLDPRAPGTSRDSLRTSRTPPGYAVNPWRPSADPAGIPRYPQESPWTASSCLPQ